MLLSNVKLNETVIIKSLPNNDSFRLRLEEMGVTIGTRAKCLLMPIFKSPILFLIKDSLIAIRKDDCNLIEVEYE